MYTALPYPTLPYPTLHYPTLHYPTLPYRTVPYTTLHYTTLPYPTLPYPTLPYPTRFLTCRRAAVMAVSASAMTSIFILLSGCWTFLTASCNGCSTDRIRGEKEGKSSCSVLLDASLPCSTNRLDG